MKNFAKFLGAMRGIAIIAMIAVIGFSFAGCGGEDDNGGNNNGGNTGGGGNPMDALIGRWEKEDGKLCGIGFDTQIQQYYASFAPSSEHSEAAFTRYDLSYDGTTIKGSGGSYTLATVTGNSLTVSSTDHTDYNGTYTKKRNRQNNHFYQPITM